MSYSNIFGFSVSDEDIVILPNEDMIILADYGVLPSWYTKGAIDFCNHNIFRLDKTGKIIWQVQRDEQGKVNWEAAHEIERARGKDGERRPFGELHVMTDQGESTHSKTWLPGLVLRALSNGIYEVDIETGIAKNVTPTPWKNW